MIEVVGMLAFYAVLLLGLLGVGVLLNKNPETFEEWEEYYTKLWLAGRLDRHDYEQLMRKLRATENPTTVP